MNEQPLIPLNVSITVIRQMPELVGLQLVSTKELSKGNYEVELKGKLPGESKDVFIKAYNKGDVWHLTEATV